VSESNLKSNFLSYRIIYVIYFIFTTFFILIAGCGTDSEENEVLDPDMEIQKGWKEYNSGNYGIATLAFEKTLVQDGPHLSEANNGLAWIYLSSSVNAGINRLYISKSLSKFQNAINLDARNADAWVGKAGLLLIRRQSQDDLKDALNSIDSALQGDAIYLYRHDYYSKADLYALKAQCYYYLGEVDKAREEVKSILSIEADNRVALALEKLLR